MAAEPSNRGQSNQTFGGHSGPEPELEDDVSGGLRVLSSATSDVRESMRWVRVVMI